MGKRIQKERKRESKLFRALDKLLRDDDDELTISKREGTLRLEWSGPKSWTDPMVVDVGRSMEIGAGFDDRFVGELFKLADASKAVRDG